MKPTVLAPDAQAEIEGAAEWYEGRREGLALRFFSHVNEALMAIEETPSAFPRWEHDPRFRKFVLQ
jgi:hypothetical protein